MHASLTNQTSPGRHSLVCGFELAEDSGKWAKDNSNNSHNNSQHILLPSAEPLTLRRALSHLGSSNTPVKGVPSLPLSQKQQLRYSEGKSVRQGPTVGQWQNRMQGQCSVSPADRLTGGPRPPSLSSYEPPQPLCFPAPCTQAWTLSSPQTCGQLGKSPRGV